MSHYFVLKSNVQAWLRVSLWQTDLRPWPLWLLNVAGPFCQKKSSQDLDQLRCLSAWQVCWRPLRWPGGPSGRTTFQLKVPLHLELQQPPSPQGQIHHLQLLQPLIRLLKRSFFWGINWVFFCTMVGWGLFIYSTQQLQYKKTKCIETTCPSTGSVRMKSKHAKAHF